MEKSIQITLIIAVTILLLAGLGFYIYEKSLPVGAGEKTVSVSGNSVIKANPDLVKIYFNMETNASTSSEATSLNSEQVDKMITALVKLGLERKDIQTTGFNVYKWQEWENNKMVDKGYKATHQIIIELNSEKFSIIGNVIDAGTNAEAMVSYINFELSNAKQNEYKALAFKQASEDSRIKAESIAEGLNKQLGDVLSVSVNEWGYNPWPLYSGRMEMSVADNAAFAKQATTNIQPGEQDISGTVTVVYALR